MYNRRVKFCLKILSRFGKIIRKPQGVKFFGAPYRLTLDPEHVDELMLLRSHYRQTHEKHNDDAD